VSALGKQVMEIEILQVAREEARKRPRFYTVEQGPGIGGLAAESGEEGQVEIVREAGSAPAKVGHPADEAELPAAAFKRLLHARTGLQQGPHPRCQRRRMRCCSASPSATAALRHWAIQARCCSSVG